MHDDGNVCHGSDELTCGSGGGFANHSILEDVPKFRLKDFESGTAYACFFLVSDDGEKNRGDRLRDLHVPGEANEIREASQSPQNPATPTP